MNSRILLCVLGITSVASHASIDISVMRDFLGANKYFVAAGAAVAGVVGLRWCVQRVVVNAAEGTLERAQNCLSDAMSYYDRNRKDFAPFIAITDWTEDMLARASTISWNIGYFMMDSNIQNLKKQASYLNDYIQNPSRWLSKSQHECLMAPIIARMNCTHQEIESLCKVLQKIKTLMTQHGVYIHTAGLISRYGTILAEQDGAKFVVLYANRAYPHMRAAAELLDMYQQINKNLFVIRDQYPILYEGVIQFKENIERMLTLITQHPAYLLEKEKKAEDDREKARQAAIRAEQEREEKARIERMRQERREREYMLLLLQQAQVAHHSPTVHTHTHIVVQPAQAAQPVQAQQAPDQNSNKPVEKAVQSHMPTDNNDLVQAAREVANAIKKVKDEAEKSVQ